MSELKVAIVGAGLAGTWHARYARRAGGAVVAVVDPYAPAAEALAHRVGGARTFAVLSDCLAGAAVDVVHICTPGTTHATLVSESLDARKHVLVEKPATQTLEELRACLDLASQHDRKFSVVHQFPHQRGVRSIRAKLDRLGELVSLSFATCSAGGEGRTAEQRREILLDILPHPVSLFFNLLGERLDAAALEVTRFDSHELVVNGMCDDVRVDLRIDLRGRPTLNQLVATGTRATAYADLFHGFSFIDTASQAAPLTKMARPFRMGADLLTAATINLAIRTIQRDTAYPGLRELIEGFYNAVRTNSPAPVIAAEMILVAEAVDHVRASALEQVR